MKKIIMIYGLPGSGKTTLAKILSRVLNGKCIWLNADRIRESLSSDLTFSVKDRVEQARRLGCLASIALDNDHTEYAIVDFVNPTNQTYATFVVEAMKAIPHREEHHVYVIWMDTVKYEDTNLTFEGLTVIRRPNLIQTEYLDGAGFESLATSIVNHFNAVDSTPEVVSNVATGEAAVEIRRLAGLVATKRVMKYAVERSVGVENETVENTRRLSDKAAVDLDVYLKSLQNQSS